MVTVDGAQNLHAFIYDANPFISVLIIIGGDNRHPLDSRYVLLRKLHHCRGPANTLSKCYNFGGWQTDIFQLMVKYQKQLRF